VKKRDEFCRHRIKKMDEVVSRGVTREKSIEFIYIVIREAVLSQFLFFLFFLLKIFQYLGKGSNFRVIVRNALCFFLYVHIRGGREI